MRSTFDAAAVASRRDADLNTEYLVLAEHHDGSGRSLEVQRPPQSDIQHETVGQDTYCIVVDGGATHYGGVLDWRIDGSTLRLGVDEEAALALGAHEFCVVLLQAERTGVEAALRTLLR
jgi:hypothetical protein